MARSLKKGPFVDPRLLEKLQRSSAESRHEPIKTWSRRCTIPPEFVGRTFEVHNGKTFTKVFVIEDMVGHKLGEFSPTRIWRGHTQAKKRAR